MLTTVNAVEDVEQQELSLIAGGNTEWNSLYGRKMSSFLQTVHTLTRKSESVSSSVVSNCLQLRGLQPTRLLCPWHSPGKNTGVGFHTFSRGGSQHRHQTQVSCTAGSFFTIWAIWQDWVPLKWIENLSPHKNLHVDVIFTWLKTDKT